MKKILSIIAFCMSLAATAQEIYICKDGDYTHAPIAEGLSIDLSSQPDSVTFAEPAIPWVVDIFYGGTTAQVSMPRFMAEKVTCSSGTSSQVNIVNTDTIHEVIYNVSGASSNGSLTIKSDHKMTVNLNGVSLTSTKGEAMRFKCGKRVALVMAEGSTNTFADTNDNGVTNDANDTHKACIYTKGHIELSGAGTLNVTGNYHHAIATKEYFKVKKTVQALNILGAVGDGIHTGEYFQMNGGTLTIDENTLGDGLQVEYKTDSIDDQEVIASNIENTGGIVIKDGTINITSSATEDIKCIKADGNIDIKGGTLVINATANGSRCIQTDGDVTISQDSTVLTSLTLTASGAKCEVVADAADPHKSCGIKLDGNFTFTGGTAYVYASGKSSNGIRTSGNYTASGGYVEVRATNTNTNCIKIDGNLLLKSGSTTKAFNTGTKAVGITYVGSYTKEDGATLVGSVTQKKD